MLPSQTWSSMLDAAQAARAHSYAPYSHYHVGAAVLGSNGNIYSGCNVESASFGAVVCAERAAVCAMVADGCQTLSAVLVCTSDRGTPCGICRQFMIEMCDDPATVEVICQADTGQVDRYWLSELLPHAFRLQEND